jgi:hypothetical protein
MIKLINSNIVVSMKMEYLIKIMHRNGTFELRDGTPRPTSTMEKRQGAGALQQGVGITIRTLGRTYKLMLQLHIAKII